MNYSKQTTQQCIEKLIKVLGFMQVTHTGTGTKTTVVNDDVSSYVHRSLINVTLIVM